MKIAKYAAAAAFAASLTLLTTSCPSPLTSYYIQQQNRAAGSGSEEPEPEPDYGSSGSVLPALPSGQYNAFEIILKDGAIADPSHDGKAKTQVSGKLGGGTEANYNFQSSMFDNWKFIASFTSDNVSQMKYEDTTTWTQDGNREKYNGADSYAGSYTIRNMTYYRYVGAHPNGLYKNETYPLYGTDGNKTGQTEALMKRFIFYRFTGSVPLVSLDNPLVAVDTYSKLVYSYARPTGFTGLGVPTGWIPIDRADDAKKDSTGRKYRFYEYDPAGYVTEDGHFHVTEEYKTALKTKNYIPEVSGKSPYQNCGGSVESPLGTLTVKAKSLKNVSVTDGWWSGEPEFVWDVRARAYSGTEVPSWDSLAKQKDNFNYNIARGATHTFTTDASKKETESKQDYALAGAGPHKLELDSLIVELNGHVSINEIINTKITWYEKPVIYLEYDETAKYWKLSDPATNNQFNYGAVTLPENFTLSAGETKDFVITLPSSSNEKMELCYELSWTAAK
ncbi:MAG: hypothetical protein ACTTKL_05625 [Treponema sp.]